VYWRVGGADEKLTQCGDWKMWAAMALTGGVWAAETLHVIGWILKRITPDEAVMARVRDDLAYLWIPAVLNRRIPASRRWAILKDAVVIDQHALRRLTPPTLTAVRLTVRRRWRSLWAALEDL
jgi:hypothetical protein